MAKVLLGEDEMRLFPQDREANLHVFLQSFLLLLPPVLLPSEHFIASVPIHARSPLAQLKLRMED